MAIFNCNLKIKSAFVTLLKSLIPGIFLLLTACMSPPNMKPIPDNMQPESLYSHNLWTNHKPYDIMSRIAPILSSINAVSASLNQSINSAYNIQSRYIAEENKRLITSYQYTNQTYHNRLESERQQKLLRLKELETLQQQKNPKARLRTINAPQSIQLFNPRMLYDPDSGLYLQTSSFIVEQGQGLGTDLRYRNCMNGNVGISPEYQQDCKR